MKMLLNSNLFPIISVGMYQGRLSSDNLFDSYTIDSDYQDGSSNFDSSYFWEHWQNDLFVDEIQALAAKFLDGKLENDGIEITIKTGEIYSPKYYNFATDNIDLEIVFNKTKILRYAKDHQENFDRFLRKNYSSYDGFLSSTANNYAEWLSDFKTNNDQSVGAVLTYIFRDLIEDYHEEFFAYVEESIQGYGQFVDYEPISAEIAIIADYIQANYTNLDLEDLKDSYEWEFLSEDRVERIAKELIAEIDGLTLDLFNT